MPWFRRALLAAFLTVIGILLFGRFNRRPTEPAGVAEWPPLEPRPPHSAPTPRPQAPLADAPQSLAERSPAPTDTWVVPIDGGTCPDGYPVKANANSGIFHLPGGRFYERTRAERCYARAEDAETDGYRPAKA